MRLAALIIAALATPAMAIDDPQVPLDDPYRSGMWDYQQVNILGDPAEIRFDDRVIVRAPHSAEDAFEVPVTIDASAIPDVEKIVVTVDYGPIPKILTYHPGEAEARLSFRFKIDQATPIRASVMDHDGRWFVGGTEIDAAGGGCTAPAQAYANADWEEKLGEVRARMWPQTGRLRMILDHPMDTGLADGIPVFIIEDLVVHGPGGEMARVEMYEPVDEDPALTLYFRPGQLSHDVRIEGRDNNGNEIDATVPVPLTQ
ncbi:MAG: quinoprotein dehydrogenase-associated SoxYZ-like carrier [Pseudomonadota bacterium]